MENVSLNNTPEDEIANPEGEVVGSEKVKIINRPAYEAFELQDFFNLNSKTVKFHMVDSDMKKLWGGSPEEAPCDLTIKTLTKGEDEETRSASLTDVRYLLEQQPNGESGHLLIDGKINYFLIGGCLVSVYRGSQWGWDIHLDKRIPSQPWWNDGDQLISSR